jgi:hypothetical protein
VLFNLAAIYCFWDLRSGRCGLVVGCDQAAVAWGAASFTLPPHTIRMSFSGGKRCAIGALEGNLSSHGDSKAGFG